MLYLKGLWLIPLATLEDIQCPQTETCWNPLLFPRVACFLNSRGRMRSQMGGHRDKNNGRERCCSPQSHLLYIPSSNMWLLSTYCIPGLEISWVCVDQSSWWRLHGQGRALMGPEHCLVSRELLGILWGHKWSTRSCVCLPGVRAMLETQGKLSARVALVECWPSWSSQ